jgi:RND family efflux transporter MFP subunit
MSSVHHRLALAVLALAVLALGALPGCRDSAAEGAVAPSEPQPIATQQRVRTVAVRKATLDSMQSASGIVRAFHKATVTAETQGRVLARAVERGQRVDAGDVLLELDDSRLALELRKAEATLKARTNDRAHAQREYDRGERLVAQNAISAQQRDDLHHNLDRARDEQALALVARDTARRNLEDARITAPFAGRVDDLLVDVGDYVAPGSAVATVVELSRARVFAGVTAQTAARLEPGSEANVHLAALGGVEIPATLRSVATVASERDGTYEVELWIEAPPRGIRDGMIASVELASTAGDAVPLAPRAGLLRRNGKPEIFVVERDGEREVARLRQLRTRRSAGEWIEVLEGLAEGDRVVVDGQFALRDGAPVIRDDAGARATR